MSPPKVIVFGPTGAVGSATARIASALGSPVVLAMRDPSKPIRGLTSAAETAGNFQRVEADLTNPATVSSAVTTTNAKHAFIYAAHGGQDHMRGTIEALKKAGIELVVFLSSFTVTGNLKAIEPSEFIPYVHAQVELVLGEVFGENGFIAARPGSFASNTLQYKAGLQEGEVGIFRPDASVDSVVPEDIGRVCGTALVKGPLAGERKLYLYGPKLMTQREQVKVLARVLGKESSIKELDEDEAYKQAVEVRKVPPPVAKYMVGQVSKTVKGQLQVFGYPIKEEDLSTVQKYSGTKGTSFEEWVEQNKDLFLT